MLPSLASSTLCSQGSSSDFPGSRLQNAGIVGGHKPSLWTSYRGECGGEAEAWFTLGLVQWRYILSLRNQALKFPFSLSGYPPSLSFYPHFLEKIRQTLRGILKHTSAFKRVRIVFSFVPS